MGTPDCSQCKMCTDGCPIAFAMDILPHNLIHLLESGRLDEVQYSETVRLCTSCQICSERCPNGIDISHLIDTLRQSSCNEVEPSQYSASHLRTEFPGSTKKLRKVDKTEITVIDPIKDSIWLKFLKILRL